MKTLGIGVKFLQRPKAREVSHGNVGYLLESQLILYRASCLPSIWGQQFIPGNSVRWTRPWRQGNCWTELCHDGWQNGVELPGVTVANSDNEPNWKLRSSLSSPIVTAQARVLQEKHQLALSLSMFSRQTALWGDQMTWRALQMGKALLVLMDSRLRVPASLGLRGRKMRKGQEWESTE